MGTILPSGTLMDPSGFLVYKEYYLYSEKRWEMAPAGVSYYDLEYPVTQNAPIVVTASGYETTSPSDPWAQVNGSGKFEKVGFGYFNELDDGSYDPTAYEFSLHPEASGKIVFNGILTTNVYVEYESGPSGYYIMDTVDYNPIRNEVEGGFVHFSQTTQPTNLFLDVSQESVRADGYQGVRMTASVYDSDFDRVPDAKVVFELENLKPANTIISNGSFESWPTITSILTNGDFSSGNPPTGWTLVGAGSSCSTVTDIIKNTPNSLKLTTTGTNCYVNRSCAIPANTSTYILGGWVYQEIYGVNISGVQFTIGGVNVTEFHSPNPGWEYVSIGKNNTSQTSVIAYLFNYGPSGSVYFNDFKAYLMVNPVGWTFTGSGGYGYVSQNEDHTIDGKYSAKLNQITQSTHAAQIFRNDLGNLETLKGKRVNFGAYCYCEASGAAQLYLYDGVLTVSSPMHTGSGWEFLEASKVFPSNSTISQISCISWSASSPSYFDLTSVRIGVTDDVPLGSGVWCDTGWLQEDSGVVYTADASGRPVSVLETTNRRGDAFCSYMTRNTKSGLVSVKAYVLDASGVYDDAQFMQYYMSAQPFILDLSLLDTLDYLV